MGVYQATAFDVGALSWMQHCTAALWHSLHLPAMVFPGVQDTDDHRQIAWSWKPDARWGDVSWGQHVQPDV